MKHLKLAIIYFLILAIPTSNFASMIVVSHCHLNSTLHSMHIQSDENEFIHEMHSEHQTTHQESNGKEDCGCSCSDEIDCTVSGCVATVLMNVAGIDTRNLLQIEFKNIETLNQPPDPTLLFRPPIILF